MCHFVLVFFSPFSIAITSLGKELILVLFVRFFGLCLFGFVSFLFLLVSGKGSGLWMWHSLDFSITFFSSPEPKAQGELLWSLTVRRRRRRRRPAVRPSTNLQTAPPKPLIGIWPYFTGMILGWSSFKVVQMVPVHCISRSQELKIYLLIKLQKSSCQKPMNQIQYNFAEMFLWWSSTQDCSSRLDLSKNTAAMGRGLFSLYIYIENFKNLLVRNHWTDFNIILQKCFFGDPLLRLFKPFWWSSTKIVQAFWIHQKTWPPGGVA